MNDNKIGNDRKELMYKINNEYSKYKKDNDDYINIIKNDIKIYENNIEDKRQKSVGIENEYNKLKKEFDEYKNETYKIINALMERYNLYYNNFIIIYQICIIFIFNISYIRFISINEVLIFN